MWGVLAGTSRRRSIQQGTGSWSCSSTRWASSSPLCRTLKWSTYVRMYTQRFPDPKLTNLVIAGHYRCNYRTFIHSLIAYHMYTCTCRSFQADLRPNNLSLWFILALSSIATCTYISYTLPTYLHVPNYLLQVQLLPPGVPAWDTEAPHPPADQTLQDTSECHTHARTASNVTGWCESDALCIFLKEW